MNFLMRSSQPVVPDLPKIPESAHHKDVIQKQSATLEGLIADDPFPVSAPTDDDAGNSDRIGSGIGDISEEASNSDLKNQDPVGKHIDVAEDEGWITIPYTELPDNWNNVADMEQLRSLDRSFLFPGEQVHILVCQSASKQDAEIITPFRIAAVMSRNGKSTDNGRQPVQPSSNISSSVNENGDVNGVPEESAVQKVENNGEISLEETSKQNISETKSLLLMEDHKLRIESMLQRFRNSNFFVRIAELDEPLWSKKKTEQSAVNSEVAEERSYSENQGSNKVSSSNMYNAVTDKGVFDGTTSGGAARDIVRCYALANGDIVVLLRVNVGVSKMKDPMLEVLQFEKSLSSNSVSQKLVDGLSDSQEDPYRELLSWLLPLDRALPSPRPLSPPLNPSISHKPSYSASGSQMFSFGHFRSYSMPSLAQATPPPPPAGQPLTTRPAFEVEEFDSFAPEKPSKSVDIIREGNLSFRGVPLEPERYSVRCGLEGVYLPGRRWRRKVKIIQPIEVHSFAAKCSADNLLCVLIKNVAPSHVPDIVVFVDAITVVFEEASKGGAPSNLPIASIEVGNGHSLPNLALRSGEEHSFILKPATMLYKEKRGSDEANPAPLVLRMTGAPPNLPSVSRTAEQRSVSVTDQYAVLVSYRCNFTESKLFFKQPTSWRPCVASDLKISVSSQPYIQNSRASARVPELPVQVLTLEATNLTSEDLALTVLAPEASSSSPILSLNSAPTSPVNSYGGLHEFVGRTGANTKGFGRLSSISASLTRENDNGGNRLSAASGCTHLWLQSAVPLGCVPARSSTTVKLELLPLTDGIITLDTLQITIKEKGLTYVPEHSLEIYATSSISTGIS